MREGRGEVIGDETQDKRVEVQMALREVTIGVVAVEEMPGLPVGSGNWGEGRWKRVKGEGVLIKARTEGKVRCCGCVKARRQ